MQFVLTGKFVDGLMPFARFQGYFEFELVAMLSAFSTYFLSSTS